MNRDRRLVTEIHSEPSPSSDEGRVLALLELRLGQFEGPEQLTPTAHDRIAKASEWLSVARGERMPATGSLFGDLSPDRSYIE
jgi:hypothetical protein